MYKSALLLTLTLSLATPSYANVEEAEITKILGQTIAASGVFCTGLAFASTNPSYSNKAEIAKFIGLSVGGTGTFSAAGAGLLYHFAHQYGEKITQIVAILKNTGLFAELNQEEQRALLQTLDRFDLLKKISAKIGTIAIPAIIVGGLIYYWGHKKSQEQNVQSSTHNH